MNHYHNKNNKKRPLIARVLRLNDQPVLYQGKDFYLMGFGLFLAISIFLGISIFSTYAASRGMYFHYPLELWACVVVFIMVLASKLLHPFVIGKDYFKRPGYYLKQTAFYNQGGQIGLLVGMALMCYVENINFLLLMDAVCYAGCASLIVGRLGCYNYGCCYGKPTQSRFSVTYTNPYAKILRLHPELSGVPVLPTQLIETIFNLALFILLTFMAFHNPRDGLIAVIFISLYNLFRMFIHRFRANDVTRAGITSSDKGIFFIFALAFSNIGLAGLSASVLFYHYFPITSVVEPLSLQLYLSTNFTNIPHLITLLVISIICFFIYGYHHNELGRHF